MSKEPKTAFDAACQLKGLDASEVMTPHWLAMKRAFKTDPNAICDPLHSISFLLRIDGKFGTFNCKEAELPKLNRRGRSASVDIGIPISAWKERKDLEIAQYCRGAFRLGLDLVLELSKRRKIDVPDIQTRERLEKCLEHYVRECQTPLKYVEPEEISVFKRGLGH